MFAAVTFLHVLIQILKIIGIVLLCLIGLIVLILLAILLIPIRYRLEGRRITDSAEPVYGYGKISWGANALRLKVDYEDKGLHIYAKGLWLWIYDSWQEMDDKHNRIAKFVMKKLGMIEDEEPEAQSGKSGGKPSKEKPETGQKADPKQEKDDDLDWDEEPEQPAKPPAETEESKKQKADRKKNSEKQKAAKKQEPDEKEDTRKDTDSFFDKLDQQVSAKYHALVRKIEGIYNNLMEKKKKVESILKLLGQDFTQRFLKNTLKNIGRIIAHVLPTSLKGWIHFGIADNPELMGKILMWIGMFYPIYGKSVKVEPEFDRSFGDFDLVIKGRIRIGYIFLCILRIVLKKDTFKLLNYLRNEM